MSTNNRNNYNLRARKANEQLTRFRESISRNCRVWDQELRIKIKNLEEKATHFKENNRRLIRDIVVHNRIWPILFVIIMILPSVLFYDFIFMIDFAAGFLSRSFEEHIVRQLVTVFPILILGTYLMVILWHRQEVWRFEEKKEKYDRESSDGQSYSFDRESLRKPFSYYASLAFKCVPVALFSLLFFSRLYLYGFNTAELFLDIASFLLALLFHICLLFCGTSILNSIEHACLKLRWMYIEFRKNRLMARKAALETTISEESQEFYNLYAHDYRLDFTDDEFRKYIRPITFSKSEADIVHTLTGIELLGNREYRDVNYLPFQNWIDPWLEMKTKNDKSSSNLNSHETQPVLQEEGDAGNGPASDNGTEPPVSSANGQSGRSNMDRDIDQHPDGMENPNDQFFDDNKDIKA